MELMCLVDMQDTLLLKYEEYVYNFILRIKMGPTKDKMLQVYRWEDEDECTMCIDVFRVLD